MRRLISSGSTFEQEIGYSRAVVDGEWVLVSGTTGFDYATMIIADDVVAQCEQCLRNIGHALTEAGCSFEHVVRVRYILPNAADFPACWPVLRRVFGDVRPAATMIAAGLSEADMKALAAYYGAQQLAPAAATDKELASLGQRIWRGGIAASGVPACAGCHGPTGAGMPAQYPRVAGQFAEYVAGQLKAFKEGARANDPNGMMRGVAARMTDQEIRAVAEYAAGLR